jgi:hypothetical protein
VVSAIDRMLASTASSSLLCLLTAREGCEWLEHLRQGKAWQFGFPTVLQPSWAVLKCAPAAASATPAAPKPARMAPFYFGANTRS